MRKKSNSKKIDKTSWNSITFPKPKYTEMIFNLSFKKPKV